MAASTMLTAPGRGSTTRNVTCRNLTKILFLRICFHSWGSNNLLPLEAECPTPTPIFVLLWKSLAYLSVVVEQGQKNRPLTQDEYTDAWHRGVHELRVSLAVASRESGKRGPVKQ